MQASCQSECTAVVVIHSEYMHEGGILIVLMVLTAMNSVNGCLADRSLKLQLETRTFDHH